ncbi:unnamed protein product [Haemonchus placei]|uniref:DDE Tnp4 domain-containing protein n=1 Tax=Haemonchus placei TaxID=6290 RepID=A0A0N4W542_HAEPC|nr:unnamed protein product [Haemonchus placei]
MLLLKRRRDIIIRGLWDFGNENKPAHSGGSCFDYKLTHSITLLALVDCENRILAFDAGAPGRVGDADTDRQQRPFVPSHARLGNVGPVQYHILIDCGFAQGHRFVRPYKRAKADTPGKRRFNAKHSGAWRAVESTFGMLSRRFGLFQTTIQMEPSHAAAVVVSLVLHNLVLGWWMQSREAEGLPSEIL